MFAVALRSHEILVNTICSSELRKNISKTLFLAASLHDLDHHGDSTHDSENIARSLKHVHGMFVDVELADAISSIIETTQFPYVSDPRSLSEMCLRDADLLMVLEPDFPIFLKGLSKELSKEITMEETIQFLKEQKFFTAYGQKLFNDFLARYEKRKIDVSLKNLNANLGGSGRIFNVIISGRGYFKGMRFIHATQNPTPNSQMKLCFLTNQNQPIEIPLNDISSIDEKVFTHKQIYRWAAGFEIKEDVSDQDILTNLYPHIQSIDES